MAQDTETDTPTARLGGTAYELAQEDLRHLFAALTGHGWTVVGPTERDGAVVLAELASADELPCGVGVTLAPGGYRLRRRTDRAAFAHSAGPQSWKTFLHPDRARLWQADRDGSGAVAFTADTVENSPPPRYALLGVHPCDLAAIARQDRVLAGGAHRDPVYAPRREAAFVIAVACGDPGALCFCASVGTGPGLADDAPCDLAVHEVADTSGVRLLIAAHSVRGAELLDDDRLRAHLREPDPDLPRTAEQQTETAARDMGRELDTEGLRDVLAETLDSPVWEDVASRCLTCGNCTMVCPTCFCTTTEDTTDLTGDHAERWRRWDSCFDLDFSYVHGGAVRTSTRSRYRQWLTHKLGTWHDQFGSSGCVGCGRCIAWCPVGIDLTAEAARLREEAER